MSYQAVLTHPGDFVKITQQEPLHFVTALTGWDEDITGAGTLKKEFRWGKTNLVRGSWIDLDGANLGAIKLDPNDTLYVDFRYTLLAGGPITINDVSLEYAQAPEAEDKFWGYRPPMLVSEKGNISNLTKIENFSFRPYQVNPAVVLYKELSYTINKLFGHDVMYARTVPMAIGKDFTLHEWTLYDVDDPCCVKLLVPNNEFPDSKITFNPMGLDFEMPFEVHIVKAYFEEVFGVGTAPQKRDIIYFPLTNRIYEVESSYLWKDIMQREVYWKVSLKKYAPKSNRYEPQDLRDGLDAISFTAEERFGEEVKEDEIKVTKPQQFDPKIGSRDYDPIRLTVEDNLVISQVPLKNFNLTLSESQYDLRSIFSIKDNPTAVTYRALNDFPKEIEVTDLEPVCEGSLETKEVTKIIKTERAVSGWVKPIKPKLTLPKDPVRGSITKFPSTPIGTVVRFLITAKRNYQVGDKLKITRFNGLTLYGTFNSYVLNPPPGTFMVEMIVNNDIISFLDAHYSGWASPSISSGYYLEPTYESVLLSGYDETTSGGWKLSLWANRFILFTEPAKEFLFILPNDMIEDSWYAFFFNVSNDLQQVSLDMWIRKWSDTDVTPMQTSDLENIFSQAKTAPAKDRSANVNYYLPASNIVYTNIRLFDKIETDLVKQINILNQTIVKDTQYAIIVDNAVPRLTLPWVGKTK
jgi:hypothetical protein